MHLDRRFRLPSYRALQAQRDAEAAQRIAIKTASDVLHKRAACELLPSDEVSAFNGNVRPEITEADCRGKKPAAQKEEANAPAEATQPREFKAGDRVRLVDNRDYNWVPIGTECTVLETRLSGCRVALADGTQAVWSRCRLELVEPSKPTADADADGWIEHDGSCMPVESDALVCVCLRNGMRYSTPDRAGFWKANWYVEADVVSPYDIVAYRVIG